MFVGGAWYDAVLPGYPVCAQAGKCYPFVCNIIVDLELLLLERALETVV